MITLFFHNYRLVCTGAHFVSKGMVKGAEAASSLMSSTTPKIISRIQPEATARPVPPTLRTGAKVARTVTHTAVNVTGYVGMYPPGYVGMYPSSYVGMYPSGYKEYSLASLKTSEIWLINLKLVRD